MKRTYSEQKSYNLACAVADFLDKYRVADGNKSRAMLNKFVADIWENGIWNVHGYDTTSDSECHYMAKIAANRIESAMLNGKNMTPSMKPKLRDWIDTVDRCVKLALITETMVSHQLCQVDAVANMEKALEQICMAIIDEDQCHPKRRGSGKAFGFARSVSPDETFHVSQMLHLTKTVTDKNGDNRMSEVMYANTVIAIHNQRLIEEGHVVHTNEVVYPDEATAKKILDDVPIEHEMKDGERERIVDAVAASIQLMSLSPEWPSIDHLMLEAGNPDNFNVAVIKSMASSDEPVASPKPETPASWAINESMKPAIDQLLASGGSTLTFDQMVQQHNDVVSENLKLQASAVAKSQANTLPVGGTDDDLRYEVSYLQASKVFNRNVKALKFDVPTLKWFDNAGNEVRHPECPEIDTEYQFRPDHLIKFLFAMSDPTGLLNIWLHGHTGTGKTTLAEQIAAYLGFPAPRLNLDSNIERSDMVGRDRITVENGSPVTEFIEGILTKAMQKPGIMILDEFDAGREDVMFVLQRALEGKGLTLTEQGGRVIQPNELFMFCATANSRGQGDEHGWYSGVRPMNVATLDRFGVFIEVDYLDKNTEIKLVKSKFPSLSDNDAEEMCQFSTEVRQAFKTGELSTTISPRGMSAMVKCFLHMSNLMPDRKTAIKKSLEIVITDRAPIDSKQTVVEIADRVFS